MPTLEFVSAPGGSVFMAELLEAVAAAFRAAGGTANTHIGDFPEPTSDTVYVVIPHEYFAGGTQSNLSRHELLSRTVGFCVEHPGTSTFETTARWLSQLAGAVDINRDSVAELGRRGHRVEHFQLGYSPLWDAWGGDPEQPRSTDVIYLGTAEHRRSRLLAMASTALTSLHSRILTPPHEPMTGQRPDFLPGVEKYRALADSKIMINLHRGHSRAAEWVRMLEAMCNGCVVLTEPCTDLAPLRPGTHLAVSPPELIGPAAAGLATDTVRQRELRTRAYHTLRSELSMLDSAQVLARVAQRVLQRGAPPSRPVGSPPPQQPPPETGARQDDPLAVDTPPWNSGLAAAFRGREPGTDGPRMAGRAVSELLRDRREADRSWLRGEPGGSGAVQRRQDSDPATGIDALIVHRPGGGDPGRLVRQLERGADPPDRVLVCLDGTAAPLPERAEVLAHDRALGLGVARNALLRQSTAPWLLVLDSELAVSARLLQRYRELAERADQHCVLHAPVTDPEHGLVAALPAERRRLLTQAYLGSGYLVRREHLTRVGAWTEHPMLEELTDHHFWLTAALAGCRSQLLPQLHIGRGACLPCSAPGWHDPAAALAALRSELGERAPDRELTI